MSTTVRAHACALAAALVALAPDAASAAPRVGVAGPLQKVQPRDPAPAAAAASIEAARNEFEPFQIVIEGGDAGVKGVSATAAALTGPGRIEASDLTLYRVGYHVVTVPSNTEGWAGSWPDPLVPDVDTYAGEKRNAFPFDVPAGESRAIWVDVFVRPGTPAGTYRGSVDLQGTGFSASVPVVLQVRDFDLPSTPTLKSAFGMGWADACIAHRGSYQACGDAGVEAFHVLYARAALDHRISLDGLVYAGPRDGDFTAFDALYGPFLSGTARTRLEGARQTSLQLAASDPEQRKAWADHFREKGWLPALFAYTCDEPPAGCSFASIPDRAAGPQSVGIRTLVTTDIDDVEEYGLASSIDILTPVINFMHDKGGASRRADYEDFLSISDRKELWWYQSCMSHGCGNGCFTTGGTYFTGWPSYMIDASGLQNRAMEWLSYRYGITGELYFATTWKLPTAWTDQCDFSGNGDGTLFYPGRPDRIGGKTDIPVESIRLKLIREGMEDHEYLHILGTLGDAPMAHDEAASLFPAPYRVTEASPERLFAARSRIAGRIEELVGDPPERARLIARRRMSGISVDGRLDEFAEAEPLEVAAGSAKARFGMLWSQQGLHVSALVSDPDLRAPATGRDGDLWRSDGVEILLDPGSSRTSGPQLRHLIVTAAGDVRDAAGAGAGEDATLDLDASVSVTREGTLDDDASDLGYVVEVTIPWSDLGLDPHEGLVAGLDLAVNDASRSGLSTADWAGLVSYGQPARWNDLELSAVAVSEPPTGSAGSGGGAGAGGNAGAGGAGGSAGGAGSGGSPPGPGGSGGTDPGGGGTGGAGFPAADPGGGRRTGCGCDAGGSAPALTLLAAVILLHRRRR